METMVIKRKRDTPESELRYRQNKRIMNEALNSLSLSRYTAITDHDGGTEYAADYDLTPPPPSSSRRNSGKHSLRSTSRQSEHESDHDVQTIEEEYMLSVIKGGQKKYLRKVDFLVDELIRKSSRSEFPKTYCPKDFDSQLPPSVGPSPKTDLALSNPQWLVNYLENGGKLQSTIGWSGLPAGGTPASPRPLDRKPNSHAGDTTHTDWGIIELPHTTSNGHTSVFKSPETHEAMKQSYYSNSASNSSESVDKLPMTSSSASSNPLNGFRNIHSNTVDSDSDAMEQEEDENRPCGLSDQLDDDEASTEMHQQRSLPNSRQNSIDSNYSDVSALSEISSSGNNPYYVDPEDNVYFMLNGDITATPHKRRDNRSYLARSNGGNSGKDRDRSRMIAELRNRQRNHLQSKENGYDDDEMNDCQSAGGYQYISQKNNLERDLGTVASGDAVFCLD